jgi:diguanylate cyclase (GGDEF)-like protein/PAS domain S-box-containing protein
MRLKLPRLGPVARISVGLTALTAMLVLAIDLVVGVFPNDLEMARQVRMRVASALSLQLAAALQNREDRSLLLRTAHDVVAGDPDIVSIGIRRDDGELELATGQHANTWVTPANGRSTLTHVVTPLMQRGAHWGRIETLFKAPAADTLPGWIRHPLTRFSLLLASVGWLLYYLFLRRVLQHLDPSASIPERVKAAFDTLTEAVMIVDQRGRIVLANRAFRGLHPQAASDAIGRRASQLDWLAASLANDFADHAWTRVMRTLEPVTGELIDIEQPNGAPLRKTVLNASAVQDAAGRVRGALVTFDDVTQLDRMNVQLRGALDELERSRAEIEAKNRELTELATRDPMTGCFNRRAFFAAFEPMFARARTGGRLCCVMTDIDHFKSFNDKYGHAVGDLVIKAVAKALGSTLRPQDILARYGGEEFVILLPELDIEQAHAVADRLRQEIEQQAGQGIEGHGELRIASSFGVSSIVQGAESTGQLLEQADAALYVAKKNGRNRVEKWRAEESVTA